MTHPPGASSPASETPRLADPSVADLVRLASAQISDLVREEMRLARGEMALKRRYAGTSAGILGAAALLAAYGVAALLLVVGLLLAEVVPAWLAALIVAVAVLSVAALMVLVGRSSLKRAVPPVPTEAASSVRDDLAEVTDALSGRGKESRGDKESRGSRDPTR
jgi:membrane protein implicated in regulation of membrane protease activity